MKTIYTLFHLPTSQFSAFAFVPLTGLSVPSFEALAVRVLSLST